MPTIRAIWSNLKERFARLLRLRTSTSSSTLAPSSKPSAAISTTAVSTAVPVVRPWPFPVTPGPSQFAYVCQRSGYKFSLELSAIARRNGRHLECPNCLKNDSAQAIDTGAPSDSPPSYTFDYANVASAVIDSVRARSVDYTPPFESGGGGDYAGAGATGSYEPASAPPAPAYEPPVVSPPSYSFASSGESSSSSSSSSSSDTSSSSSGDSGSASSTD